MHTDCGISKIFFQMASLMRNILSLELKDAQSAKSDTWTILSVD